MVKWGETLKPRFLAFSVVLLAVIANIPNKCFSGEQTRKPEIFVGFLNDFHEIRPIGFFNVIGNKFSERKLDHFDELLPAGTLLEAFCDSRMVGTVVVSGLNKEMGFPTWQVRKAENFGCPSSVIVLEPGVYDARAFEALKMRHIKLDSEICAMAAKAIVDKGRLIKKWKQEIDVARIMTNVIDSTICNIRFRSPHEYDDPDFMEFLLFMSTGGGFINMDEEPFPGEFSKILSLFDFDRDGTPELVVYRWGSPWDGTYVYKWRDARWQKIFAGHHSSV